MTRVEYDRAIERVALRERFELIAAVKIVGIGFIYTAEHPIESFLSMSWFERVLVSSVAFMGAAVVIAEYLA